MCLFSEMHMSVSAFLFRVPCAENSDSLNTVTLSFWSYLWIESTILILLTTLFFSIFSALRTGGHVGAAFVVCWAILRIRRAENNVWTLPRFHGLGWGIPVLLGGVLISLLVGPHCFLDSYSYRFPQMFFWLQKGHPWSIPNVDMRINQMPHVWPLLSTPFFLLFGERGVALPNFLSLLLLTDLFRHWARPYMDDRKADLLTLVFLSAPVFLMGGATNDNVVTCVTFLALSYHFICEFDSWAEHKAENASPSVGQRLLGLSALSFSLCCGIKPQYLVLAPLWGTWFLFAASKPWRVITPRFILVLIPLLLVSSPVPTMTVNQIRWGSYQKPNVEEVFIKFHSKPPNTEVERPLPVTSVTPKPNMKRMGIAHSFVSLGIHFLTPYLNPAYEKLNAWIQRADRPVSAWLKDQRAQFRPLEIAEHASLGFFTFLPLLVGLLLLLRSPDSRQPKPRYRWFSLPVLLLMTLAIFITTPGTLGRSFVGFVVLLVPSALFGLRKTPSKMVVAWCILCWLNGLAILILNPARPLWPVKIIANHLPGHSGIARQLHDYAHYAHRHESPDELVSHIPKSEQRIGILVEAGEPLADLWLRHERNTVVIPYPRTVTAIRLAEDDVRYLVVKDNDLPAFFGTAEWLPILCRQTGTELVATATATTYMQKGPEKWRLLRVCP